jgi:hypothetical protein
VTCGPNKMRYQRAKVCVEGAKLRTGDGTGHKRA